MGTLVHVQLYTFSYRKAVIRPQNMPKNADWGYYRSNLLNPKKWILLKVILESPRKNLFITVEKSWIGWTVWSQQSSKNYEKMPILTIFPVLGKLTHTCLSGCHFKERAVGRRAWVKDIVKEDIIRLISLIFHIYLKRTFCMVVWFVLFLWLCGEVQTRAMTKVMIWAKTRDPVTICV